MKKIILSGIVILLSCFTIYAQTDLSGIYVDGMKAEKIDCWTFDKMYLVFPINDKYKKYDKLQVKLKLSYEGEDYPTYFFLDFSPQSFSENFEGASYGVWKILTNKNKDEISGTDYYTTTYKRKDFAVTNEEVDGWFLRIELYGYVLTGYSDDGYGNKKAQYGDGAAIYKSTQVPVSRCYEKDGGLFTKAFAKKCPWDVNASCQVIGTTTELKIEESFAYRDDLGIIK